MFECDFDVPKNYKSRYKIIIDQNKIWVKYNYFPIGFKGNWDGNLYNFNLDIRNIPELIKGIIHVFYGDVGTITRYYIKENGDDIWMNCNYEMVSPSDIYVRNDRDDPDLEQPFFQFLFETNEIPRSPVQARIPTPAMVWVTDTLKKIFDDWKDKNNGAVA